jgi:RHS repeat-associated protein
LAWKASIGDALLGLALDCGTDVVCRGSRLDRPGSPRYRVWGTVGCLPRRFGAIRSETGGQANDYRFTGQQLDSETAFYYLCARYYDPSNGRFLTPDPFGGFLVSPQSLNRYPYSVNDPINLVDPWGLCGVRSLGDLGDCVKDAADTARDAAADAAQSGQEAVSSVNWKNVAVGGTLIVAGGGLIAVSVFGLSVVIPAELAMAPESGLLTALLVPHTVGVIGWVGLIGVGTAYCGFEMVFTGGCFASRASASQVPSPGYHLPPTAKE